MTTPNPDPLPDTVGGGCESWPSCPNAHPAVSNGYPVMRCKLTGKHPDHCTSCLNNKDEENG